MQGNEDERDKRRRDAGAVDDAEGGAGGTSDARRALAPRRSEPPIMVRHLRRLLMSVTCAPLAPMSPEPRAQRRQGKGACLKASRPHICYSPCMPLLHPPPIRPSPHATTSKGVAETRFTHLGQLLALQRHDDGHHCNGGLSNAVDVVLGRPGVHTDEGKQDGKAARQHDGRKS